MRPLGQADPTHRSTKTKIKITIGDSKTGLTKRRRVGRQVRHNGPSSDPSVLAGFPNGWEFLINFLHTYYAIIYTLDYEFLFKYLQL